MVAVTLLGCGLAISAPKSARAVDAGGASGRHLKVWVMNLSGTVWPVDSVTHWARPIEFHRCEGFVSSIAITPNGRTVYVTCAHRAFAINTVTGRVGGAIGTGPGVADQVVIAPDGKMAYVGSGNTVVPIIVSAGRLASRSRSRRRATARPGLP